MNQNIVGVNLENCLVGNGPKLGYDIVEFWNAEADHDSKLFNFAKIAWPLLQIYASEPPQNVAFRFSKPVLLTTELPPIENYW
jgi:hypothetical protein